MKKLFAVLLFTLVSVVTFGQWDSGFFVDSFGDKTNQPLISCLITDGVFANSATGGSKLTVGVVVFPDGEVPNIRIRLFEYSRDKEVEMDNGDETATLLVKLSNGTVKSFNVVSTGSSLTIGALLSNKKSEKTRAEFFSYLNGEDMRCYLTIKSKYGSESIYKFTVPSTGFKDLIATL